MVLSASREVDHYIDQELRTFRVAGSTTIFKGSLVSVQADGYVAPLTAGEKFVGIAYEKIDNSTGSDGDKAIRVFTTGDFDHALSGAAITDIGRPVFASADDTLTFSSNGNSHVGIAQDYVSAGNIILRLDTQRRAVKTVTHVVEDLAANGDIAARAIHSFNKEAWIVAARVVNQADSASGVDDGNTSVHALKIGSDTVVTETFDSTTAFPAANTAADLGALGNNHAAAGDVLTYEVTNGTTADLGPFLVEVDYV